MNTTKNEHRNPAVLSTEGLERAAFERWFFGAGAPSHAADRSSTGEYKYIAAQSSWNAWSARASVQVRNGEYICPKCGLRQELGIQGECAF